MLKMFSLTDIPPGPTDIGEILVKVSIFVIQGLTTRITKTSQCIHFDNMTFNIS